ncbi:hypothetical protein BDR26DRAFT_868756 [Obelidium mucronatum]|nr:hypothetical protein BDR26DRAFT_868756 [Obelidium mucronatum]
MNCNDNTALFAASASAARVLDYFKTKIDAAGASGSIRVQYCGEPRGKALFAQRDFARGEQVLAELGAFVIQAKENKAIANACQRCLHFCGSPQSQIELLLQRKLSASETNQVLASQRKLSKSSKNWIKGFSADKTVSCACGELYCSTDCKDKDAANGHSEICAAVYPHAAIAIAAFKDHASETNETFLLALKVFAFIASRVKSHDSPLSKDALESAVWPIKVFAKDYWWNVCMPDNHDEEEEGDTQDLKPVLQALLADSIQLLIPIFKATNTLAQMTPILTVDFYSLLMGIFERNNSSLVTPSPLLPLLEHLPEAMMQSIMERASQFISSSSSSSSHHHHDHGHDGGSGSHSHDHNGNEFSGSGAGDESDPFEALDALVAEGSGLHTIHSTINHSCTPNAMVFKDASSFDQNNSSSDSDDAVIRDGRTVIRAIRDIKAGEEITISYLDEGSLDDDDDDEDDEVDEEEAEEEREWRKMSLKEYGIDACSCSKCSK